MREVKRERGVGGGRDQEGWRESALRRLCRKWSPPSSCLCARLESQLWATMGRLRAVRGSGEPVVEHHEETERWYVAGQTVTAFTAVFGRWSRGWSRGWTVGVIVMFILIAAQGCQFVVLLC